MAGRSRGARRVKHVVVIGGGVSGLAAAHALRTRVPAGRLAVTVLEASDRLGGKVQTERAGSFVLEHGPDVFLTRKPEAADLCCALGLSLQPTLPQPRRTLVRRGNRLYEMPEGFSGLVPARVGPLLRSPLLSLRGRLRVLGEPFVPAWRGGDLTVETFLTRRVGREAYERLVAPLLSGVYGDGRVLSLEAVLPELRAMEGRHGSLVRAFAAQRRLANPDAASPPFASLADGLQALPDALAAALPDVDLRTGAAVRALHRRGGGYEVDTGADLLRADAVIVAVPANAAAPVLRALGPDLAAPLAAIPHESVATATLAFGGADVPAPLDAHGYVVPAAERRAVRAVTLASAKLAGRAPAGSALFRLFFAAPSAVDLTDDVLVERATGELRQTLGVHGAPRIARVVRWHAALPRYTLGHGSRVAAVEAALRHHPGLFIAGPSLYGAGLPDSIRVARTAALAAGHYLDSL
jgi:protoporphyrinogen/coproporphyrinogen III oxidase